MGTRFEIVMPVPDDGDAAVEARLRAAGESALEEIEIWHRTLTRFAPDSLVSHLVRHAAAGPVRLDADAFALFADALEVWRASDGAFDVTRGTGTIVLDGTASTIAVAPCDVTIDLGGIGKGHALDLAAARLRDAGVGAALLHGGTSSVVAIGRPPGRAGWPVALGPGRGAEVIDLGDAALSVSDPARQGDGVLFHRFGLFGARGRRRTLGSSPMASADPWHRTARICGKVPRPLVSVIGPSARLADAWTTALAVLGHVPAAFPRGYDVRWLEAAR